MKVVAKRDISFWRANKDVDKTPRELIKEGEVFETTKKVYESRLKDYVVELLEEIEQKEEQKEEDK